MTCTPRKQPALEDMPLISLLDANDVDTAARDGYFLLIGTADRRAINTGMRPSISGWSPG